MKRILSALPIWLILADMLYGFIRNVLQSMALQQDKLPAGDLPVSPEIAFSWLQVLVNGGMIAIIAGGLWVLLRLNRTVLAGQAMPIGVWASLGLLAVVAFSLPAWWEWAWAVGYWLKGQSTVSLDSPRYLVVALCQLWVAWLCISRLFTWYHLAKRPPATPTPSSEEPSPSP